MSIILLTLSFNFTLDVMDVMRLSFGYYFCLKMLVFFFPGLFLLIYSIMSLSYHSLSCRYINAFFHSIICYSTIGRGEISVICQDVRLLKQKFDERVPLSQSISSSQTTCRLASSGSSVKSMASLASEQGLTSETPERMSSAHMTDIQTPEIKLQNETNRRELLDDGWDLFDTDAELSGR